MRFFRKLFKPLINRYKGYYGERQVKKELKPFIDFSYHKLINGIRLLGNDGKTFEIDHIDIRRNGIFCIETKNYIGRIYGNEKQEKWVQCLNNNEKNYFYNPLWQNNSHIKQLKKELNYGYEIYSVVVFVKNNAHKTRIENVVNFDELKQYLKGFNGGKKLYSKGEVKEIYNVLKQASDNDIISKKDHIKNVKKRKKKYNYK